jgi:hypothetical protein
VRDEDNINNVMRFFNKFSEPAYWSMSILHPWLISPETLFMTFAKDNL